MAYLLPGKEIKPFVLFVEQKGYLWEELDNDTVEDLLAQYSKQKNETDTILEATDKAT